MDFVYTIFNNWEATMFVTCGLVFVTAIVKTVIDTKKEA